MPKLCEMQGVRSDEADHPVELWRDDHSGRLMVRAYNEAGYSYTEIDLWDLIAWLERGPGGELISGDISRAIGVHPKGHRTGA